jgi:RNA polymerase sigma-70 factor (ECF subfamily)
MAGEASADTVKAYLGAAVRGDRHAVERVLAAIQPFVLRYCRSRLRGGGHTVSSADDVAQEVCIAVLSALPRYRDQGRPFLAFVYGIAAHKVADAYRASRQERSEPVAEIPGECETSDGPEQLLMRGERTRELDELLAVLSERQREVVVMRVVIGLTAAETARVVGTSPESVRVTQHRALNRLRAKLAAGLDPPDACR